MQVSDDYLAIIQRVPLFLDMSGEERTRIAQQGEVLTFESGDQVLAQGRESQNLWVVLDGKCQVICQTDAKGGGNILLAEIDAPGQFGEMSFFDNAPHSASVRAATPLTVLKIPREEFERMIAEGDSAAVRLVHNVSRILAGRLRRMDQWVTQLVSRDDNNAQASEWSSFRKKLFNPLGM